MHKPIQVLIVDDSAVIRKVLTKKLEAYEDISIMGAAPDPFAARDIILEHKPDVIILDVNMPKMDGLSFLRMLMEKIPIPVIIHSSVTEEGSHLALDAMSYGAVDVMHKGELSTATHVEGHSLVDRIRHAAKARVRTPRKRALVAQEQNNHVSCVSPSLIAIGASMGGTTAIERVLETMPADAPGIVIVQHMPKLFTPHFASRLDKVCAIEVREARDGDEVRTGLALIAPGGRHMELHKNRNGFYVSVFDGPLVSQHRPSVDVMLHSVAKHAGKRAVGAILTGMGRDGVKGLLEMRNAGAFTLAESEETCVVYGMPREAVEAKAACKVVPLDRVTRELLANIRHSVSTRADVKGKSSRILKKAI